MAKIDDFLTQRGQVRQDLRTLLGHEAYTGFFDPNLEQLCAQVHAPEEEVVHGLFTLLLEGEAGIETLAYILLKDLDSDLAAVRAAEMVKLPHLTNRQRKRLENIVASWSYELWSREIEAPINRFEAPETQRFLALAGQDSLQEEEMGVLWVWATRMIHPPVRAALLEALFAHPSPKALAAAWVEVVEGDPEVMIRLAPLLGKRPEVEAGEILQRLSDHADLGVRIEADQQLRARGTLGTLDTRPHFRRSVIHESPTTGFHVVVYGVDGPTGGGRVVSGILDSWDRGLADCWAQNRLFPEDLDVVFSFPGRLVSPSTAREIRGREGAGWLLEGEKLAERRGAELPICRPVWRRLLRASPDPIPPRDVVFGLICQECRQPIRRGKKETEIPLVLGSLALCPTCLAASHPCGGCGVPVHSRAAHAVTHPESHRIDFYCDSCYAERKAPHDPIH